MGLTFLTADIFIIFSFNRWGQAVLFFAVKQKAVKQKPCEKVSRSFPRQPAIACSCAHVRLGRNCVHGR
jgi:hypothetical protein